MHIIHALLSFYFMCSESSFESGKLAHKTNGIDLELLLFYYLFLNSGKTKTYLLGLREKKTHTTLFARFAAKSEVEDQS